MGWFIGKDWEMKVRLNDFSIGVWLINYQHIPSLHVQRLGAQPRRHALERISRAK
jgi:N-acetyl-anhydromuramyl-L-alanine amidase AmpD